MAASVAASFGVGVTADVRAGVGPDVWGAVRRLCDSPLSQRNAGDGEGGEGFTRLDDGWGEVDGPSVMVLCRGRR